MPSSRKFLRFLTLVWFSLILGPAGFAADPGLAYPVDDNRPSDDQRAGSVLFFNIYTSSAASPGAQNTRISITNTSTTSAAFVHLYFVDGSNCSPSDRFICLTPDQTMTLLASDQDPGVTGYLMAVSVDFNGVPRLFNHLIGDEFVKFSTGHASALNAETIAQLNPNPTLSPDGSSALLNFGGQVGQSGQYDRVGRVLVADNIPSRADGNDTLLILNRFSGNLAIIAFPLGALFGILYNDQEEPHSFTVSGGCQLRISLSNAVPRTTPRFETVIPSGQTGWVKIFAADNLAIIGCLINFNASASSVAGAFNGGHNLHKLKLGIAPTYVVPVFPPGC